VPKYTEYFNLLYAAEGEVITPDIEEDRYLIIDRQMFGVFEVFGNGVIDGWDIAAGEGLSVIVDAGSGVIDFKYVLSESPEAIVNLEPNATIYIYAQKSLSNQVELAPVFFTSTIEIDSDAQSLIISKITTDSDSISDIDNSVRENISFLQAAIDAVKDHRHFGGSNPTQIDLSSEVRGELPAENIGDLDADKITSGRLGNSVIPQLSHFDLEDTGTLSHAQIDSFIKMLTFENSHLLGEVAATNLLQLYLSHKHIWSNVEEYTSNLFLYIPGISPDSFADTDASNASIDKVNHVVQGILSESGSILARTYVTTDDFKSYYSISNLEAVNNKLKLEMNAESTKTIVDFEGSAQDGAEIPGFVKTVTVSDDEGGFISTIDTKESGFYGGKIIAKQIITLKFENTLDSAEDWTDYDTISLSVKASDLEHGQVVFFFTNTDADGNEIAQTPITLVAQDEVTDGFKIVTRDLSSYDRDNVSKLTIFTDTSKGWDVSKEFSVTLDNIFVKKDSLYQAEGSARYRVSLPQNAQWEAVDYSYTANGGSIQFRARGASTAAALSLTPFGDFIENSGDSPGVASSSDFELDIIFSSSADKSSTPELDRFKITYSIPASDNGFIVDALDDWDNGTYSSNADITTTPGSVRIKEPISVGDIYYSNAILLAQADTNDIPVFGYRGNLAPPSPYQLIKNDLNTGYDFLYSLRRLVGGNYLFCDTGSSRIIEIDPNGNFVFGIGSFNGDSEDFAVLTSIYRSSASQLTLVFSKRVYVDGIDLSKLQVVSEDETIVLGSTDSIVKDSLVDSDGNASVVNILLSETNNDILSEKSSLKLIAEDGAFPEDVSDFFLTSKSIRIGGLDIYIGNFIYSDGIVSPVSVNLLENGRYLICNSSQWGRENNGFSSVVEMDNTGRSYFSFNQDDFYFTLETLGGAREYDEDFFVLSGIVGTPTSTIGDDIVVTTVKVHAGEEDVNNFTINSGGQFQLAASALDVDENKILGTRFFWSTDNSSVATINSFGLLSAQSVGVVTISVEGDGIFGTANVEVKEGESNPSVSTVIFTETEQDIAENAVGKTILVDRISKKVRFEYESADGLFPASVDVDQSGLFVIAEKSLMAGKSSRVIRVDSNGNVLFDFGFGQLDNPNSVRVQANNDVVISS